MNDMKRDKNNLGNSKKVEVCSELILSDVLNPAFRGRIQRRRSIKDKDLSLVLVSRKNIIFFQLDNK